MSTCIAGREGGIAEKRRAIVDSVRSIALGLRPPNASMKCFSTIALSCAFVLASCHRDCGSNLVAPDYSIVVTAQDSVTGALVANTTVMEIQQSLADTAKRSIGSDVTMYPAVLPQFGGTFTVSVAAPGYTTWSKTLSGLRCAEARLVLTARMQKSP